MKTVGFYGTIISLLAGVLFYQCSPTFMDFEPKAFRVTVFERLSGALKENNNLDSGERLFEGEIFGPESIAAYDGSLYTGTSDGCITKITGNEKTCHIKLRKQLGNGRCIRPLGMRFDNTGKLYFADGCRGIFSADIKTGSVTPLLETGEEIGGKPLTFPDDLSVSIDDVIYFSDASVKWTLKEVGLSILEHENSGRVIKFDMKTNKTSVLVEGIHFPNGVQLSKSGESLLIAEFSNHRILRHYLSGQKKGQTEVFANVPGGPDNIRPSENGYWVALFSYHNPLNAGIMDKLNEYPFLKKLIVKFQRSISSLLLFINQFWKCQHLEHFAEEMKSCFSWILPLDLYGMAVEIDEDGEIIRSIQSPSGRSGTLSEILETNEHLYAGSFLNSFIIRMKK